MAHVCLPCLGPAQTFLDNNSPLFISWSAEPQAQRAFFLLIYGMNYFLLILKVIVYITTTSVGIWILSKNFSTGEGSLYIVRRNQHIRGYRTFVLWGLDQFSLNVRILCFPDVLLITEFYSIYLAGIGNMIQLWFGRQVYLEFKGGTGVKTAPIVH